MKDRISIILAGFTPIFCVGLEHILQNSQDYQISHCFSSRDEVENFIVNGGTADILIFADKLTDITFIPKDRNMKILVITSFPERFEYDNWYYVGISGTLDWDTSHEDFFKTLANLIQNKISEKEEIPMVTDSDGAESLLIMGEVKN